MMIVLYLAHITIRVPKYFLQILEQHDPLPIARRGARYTQDCPAGDAHGHGRAPRSRRAACACAFRPADDALRRGADAEPAGLAAGREPSDDVELDQRDGRSRMGSADYAGQGSAD